jgi:hypothetical protein
MDALAQRGIVVVAQPGLEIFAPGDEPLLYLAFQNDSTNQLVEYFPDEDKITIFPNGMVVVFKDGVRLPSLHSPETDYDYGERTILQPCETFTIKIPLRCLAKLPKDYAGVYEVLTQPQLFFRGPVVSNRCHFTISAVPFGESGNGTELALQRPDWEHNKADVIARAGIRAEMINIVQAEGKCPLVRIRALRLFMSGLVEGKELSNLEKWGGNGDAVLGLEVAGEARKLKGEARIRVLQACLQNPDLAVRRKAASCLASLDHASYPRETLRQRLALEKDDILLRLIRGMLLSDQP